MSLSDKSMLVSLNLRMWTAHAADRSIAMKVERDTDADNNTMRVLKQLVPTEYTLPLKRLANYGREQHERLTLPGVMKGQQLLATALFDEYALTQQVIKENFEAEVKRFVEFYPDIIKAAPARLGRAFRESDFPSQEQIASYFSYNIRFAPVPDGGNWMLDSQVDEADMTNLRNQVENQKNEMFRDAAKELMERSKAILENLKSQADAYLEGQGNGALREVTINAVKDMAHLVCNMNITADPVLEAVGKEMTAAFADLDAKELRKSPAERTKVSEIAARILKRMEK